VTAPAGSSTTSAELAPLRWWHIEELLPIEADLFGDEKWTAGMFWNELANGHRYLVGVAADEVVGYGGVAVTAPDEAWINNIAVRRDRQRHGIGRRLLAALLDEADRRGARTVMLEVAVDNKAAQRLYGEFGFDPVAIRRGYYQPSNTDALVMRRDA
jgi:[ribosomal protein S18]-alanine N-acetyltransferase